MRNFKQVALGLIAGALAIGFSAFTNPSSNNRLTTYTFAHPAKSTSNNRTDFVYRSNLAGCSSSANICTGDWSQTAAPAEGANPAINATPVTVNSGNYTGM
ncbi:hypothetical protein [Mucilaginibacter lappiensis]|uniref:Uncharacterized protein n=1 Tax=Mucilaginibacter lappiensis TaxID=354630 RepID=A0A841JL86_9SPHI|nr:hypothetical protein [Mucilaginibacter lappiensis]MBB6131717.1 hypothetical protein [Mucilaginibacter lappiensis]